MNHDRLPHASRTWLDVNIDIGLSTRGNQYGCARRLVCVSARSQSRDNALGNVAAGDVHSYVWCSISLMRINGETAGEQASQSYIDHCCGLAVGDVGKPELDRTNARTRAFVDMDGLGNSSGTRLDTEHNFGFAALSGQHRCARRLVAI